MSRNYTPLDQARTKMPTGVTYVMFGIASLTAIIVSFTISVFLQQQARAAEPVELPPASVNAVVH